MSQGTILHLFGWDKKFLLPFRDLIHEHFSNGKHHFIVYGDFEPGDLPASPDTTVYPNLLKKSFALSLALQQADKIILHGIFSNHLYYLLALHPWCLKKCYWVICGGDLYDHNVMRKDWRWWKNWLFRSFAIKHFGHFVTFVKGDYELAQKWYGADGQYHESIMYPSNVFHAERLKPSRHSSINIQIGNSAAPSNNHFESLELLRPFRNQDIVIYAPLSYGNKKHAEKVIKLGIELFGAKFIPLTEFMPFEQYIEFLRKIDIAIFNHKRQQGMGNLITLLGLGKKIYMRSDLMPVRLFAEIGVKVYDVENIDLDPLNDEVKNHNVKIIKEYFSKERLCHQWEEIFES